MQPAATVGDAQRPAPRCDRRHPPPPVRRFAVGRGGRYVCLECQRIKDLERRAARRAGDVPAELFGAA